MPVPLPPRSTQQFLRLNSPMHYYKSREAAASQGTPLNEYLQQHSGGGWFSGIGNPKSVGKGAWEGTLGSRQGRINLAKVLAISAAGGGFAGGGVGGGFVEGAGGGPALASPSSGWLGGSGAIASRGGGGGGGFGGGGGGMAGGDFWKQAAVNTGANLVQGYLQNRAQSKADKANRKAIEARIRQALANLSPEHIMALAQQFLPQMAANMSGAGQTAIQAVREQAARTGQLEGPRALSFEAGTRAKLAGDVQQAAFDRAFNLAGNQASAITGAPYAMQQPRTGYADAIANSVNQAYFARAMSQQPQQQGVPYAYPYNPYPPQARNQGFY